MNSLRSRLIVVWALSMLASVAIGGLFIELFQQSVEARVERAAAVLSHGCDLIRDKYSFYVAGWTSPPVSVPDDRLKADLAVAVGVALAHEAGVEGGIWQVRSGALAYAFPTYEGTGPKTDLPVAESAQIQAINLIAARLEQPIQRQTVSGTQTVLLNACPLPGPLSGLTGWTMTRVQAIDGLGPLQLGLGVLLALNIAIAAWLGRTLFIYGRHVRRIEATLALADGADRMPMLERTRERELDKIIDALNQASRKLDQARDEAEAMAARAAQAERLAGLGRVAAGVAHEIRNPLAALQLQGENALQGNDARRYQAITDMLKQAGRLDRLVTELLAMTQRIEPAPETVTLPDFLEDVLAQHRPIADSRHITLSAHAGTTLARFDPHLVGRILDNLLSNAVRHARTGGTVTLDAARHADRLLLTVTDDGTGVAGEITARLFEPFVTGRPDGTGLGLSIARELADAHGAQLTLSEPREGAGAAFVLDLPQPP